jgi:hypothetical protein
LHVRFIALHHARPYKGGASETEDSLVKTRPQPQKFPTPEPEKPLSPARAFVVQFREQADSANQHFSGRAEHMTSGDAVRFQSPEELLAFFAEVLRAMQSKVSDGR